MEEVWLEITELEWYPDTIFHIRKHGGSIGNCREVLDRSPRFHPQQGRRGNHLMIGPNRRGRLWTVAIDYMGDGIAAPVASWPSNPKQRRWYQERNDAERRN